MQQFWDLTCTKFATVELPQEAAARKRGKAKLTSMASSLAEHPSAVESTTLGQARKYNSWIE